MTDERPITGAERGTEPPLGPISKTVCCDCLEFMRSCADGEFDLAIVDPPYGIGKNWIKPTKTRGRRFEKSQYDNQRVGEEYFRELKRISKEQIIWGYNYYTEFLGSTNYLIIWDKKTSNNPKLHYSKCEIAYTSKRVPCNIISLEWDGYRMGGERGVKKIHPHQKPVALYEWLLKNYAKPGDRIFDSHLGSGSSRIAAARLGFDFVGCEIDPFFYEAQERRFRDYKAQKELNFN